MCMDDSLRIGHKANFMTAMEMERQTLEKYWMEGKDGGESGFTSLSPPEKKATSETIGKKKIQSINREKKQ